MPAASQALKAFADTTDLTNLSYKRTSGSDRAPTTIGTSRSWITNGPTRLRLSSMVSNMCCLPGVAF